MCPTLLFRSSLRCGTRPRCVLTSFGSANTVYAVCSLHFAHPYSATDLSLIKYGCSGTSHILERYMKYFLSFFIKFNTFAYG